MSARALFVRLGESEVMARCLKENVGVSSIEKIPSGGVRLVCMSVNGAERMRTKLKSQMIAGEVVRERHRPARPLW
jgi:hypothetical protein